MSDRDRRAACRVTIRRETGTGAKPAGTQGRQAHRTARATQNIIQGGHRAEQSRGVKGAQKRLNY